MDLPYDIKELIASNLSGPELATMSKIDKDFRGFLAKLIAPVFRQEFINTSKLLPYLRRILFFKPTSQDIRFEGGDSQMMSYILDREVEEGELFEDEIEYNIWRTVHGVVDLDVGLYRIVEEYKYNKYVFDINRQVSDEILDEYFFKNYGDIFF